MGENEPGQCGAVPAHSRFMLLQSAILRVTGSAKTTAINELCVNISKASFQIQSVQCPARLMSNFQHDFSSRCGAGGLSQVKQADKNQ